MNKEQIVASYMEALGEEKLSEETWKRIADVNANILDENPNYLSNLPNGTNWLPLDNDIEVIGNIYENPELLQSEPKASAA